MSEPTNQPGPVPVPPAGPPQDPAPQAAPATPPAGDPPNQGQQDEPLGEGGIKALHAEREARKAAEKAAAEATARIKEFEDRDKSELQKLTEAQAAAEQQRDQATREALRWRIAARHQISDADAEVFLTGGDEETITRQAQRLAELRGAGQQSPPAPGQRTPVEHLRPGALPNPPEPSLGDQIAAAEKAGSWAEARQLKTRQLMQLAEQTK